jgi:hypothetical protein
MDKADGVELLIIPSGSSTHIKGNVETGAVDQDTVINLQLMLITWRRRNRRQESLLI